MKVSRIGSEQEEPENPDGIVMHHRMVPGWKETTRTTYLPAPSRARLRDMVAGVSTYPHESAHVPGCEICQTELAVVLGRDGVALEIAARAIGALRSGFGEGQDPWRATFAIRAAVRVALRRRVRIDGLLTVLNATMWELQRLTKSRLVRLGSTLDNLHPTISAIKAAAPVLSGCPEMSQEFEHALYRMIQEGDEVTRVGLIYSLLQDNGAERGNGLNAGWSVRNIAPQLMAALSKSSSPLPDVLELANGANEATTEPGTGQVSQSDYGDGLKVSAWRANDRALPPPFKRLSSSHLMMVRSADSPNRAPGKLRRIFEWMAATGVGRPALRVQPVPFPDRTQLEKEAETLASLAASGHSLEGLWNAYAGVANHLRAADTGTAIGAVFVFSRVTNYLARAFHQDFGLNDSDADQFVKQVAYRILAPLVTDRTAPVFASTAAARELLRWRPGACAETMAEAYKAGHPALGTALCVCVAEGYERHFARTFVESVPCFLPERGGFSGVRHPLDAFGLSIANLVSSSDAAWWNDRFAAVLAPRGRGRSRILRAAQGWNGAGASVRPPLTPI